VAQRNPAQAGVRLAVERQFTVVMTDLAQARVVVKQA
jgi:hypothetical protein